MPVSTLPGALGARRGVRMPKRNALDRIPVAVAGLGQIGREVARAVLARPELELVGALETDPELIGGQLSRLLDLRSGPADLRIEGEEAAVFERAGEGLLLQPTDCACRTCWARSNGRSRAASTSFLPARSRLPWLRHAELADKLEELARRAKRSVLGTGINPGFVLDRLVCTLGLLGHIQKVHAERVVDAGTRRAALVTQARSGAH